MIDYLPVELLLIISSHLHLNAYQRLRACCKSLNVLGKIPTLCFKAYKETTDVLGLKLSYRSSRHKRIKLSPSDLKNESFVFLAARNHTPEFTDCVQRHGHRLSAQAKIEAIQTIVKLNSDPCLIVTLLEDADADPNTPVMYTGVWNGAECQVVHHLSQGKLIHWAAENCHQTLTAKLLDDARVDPTVPDHFGDQVVHISSFYGNLPILKLLLNSGKVQHNAIGYKRQIPLHSACISGKSHVVKHLLRYPGDDINARDINGQTPIHLAAQEGDYEVLHVLLNDPRIDPNLPDYEGEYPIVF
jgi:Ankyrin repeats (3 copies)